MSKTRKIMLIIALLFLNIVEQAASVITATIPGMAKTFSNVSLTNVEMLTTIVSMFVTVFVLVSGVIVKKIGQKQTALLGMVIAAVSSIVPAFSNSYMVVLISRAVLGIGIGLANPLAISLIGTFFKGDERAKLMGWRSAVAGVGTSLMTYFAGQLLKISWHASYLVYLLFIPAVILFVIFVPVPEKEGYIDEESNTETDGKKSGQSQTGKGLLITLMFLMFMAMVCFMILSVKLPTFLVQNKIGTAPQAATAWSIHNLAGLLGGMCFGYLYKHLRQYLLPAGLALVGLGFIMIGFTKVMGIIYLLNILTGFAASNVTPYIFNRISEVALPQNAPFYTSLALVGSNFGSFISPYAGSFIGKTGKFAIINAGIILIILAVITLVAAFRKVKTVN